MPKLTAAGIAVCAATMIGALFAGNWPLFWGAFAALFGVAETNGVLSETEGDTLSEQTRAFWRTKTLAGRIVFTVIWGTFAVLFGGHIAGVVWP